MAGNEVIDKYARRIFQKYRLHPDGWARDMDALNEAIDDCCEDPHVGVIAGTLIRRENGVDTTVVQSLAVGNILFPVDPADPLVVTAAPTTAVHRCYTFVTDLGKTMTIAEHQPVMEKDGGWILAEQLVLGNEIQTKDGNEVIVSRTLVVSETVYSFHVNTRPMWYLANGIWLWTGETTGLIEDGDDSIDLEVPLYMESEGEVV